MGFFYSGRYTGGNDGIRPQLNIARPYANQFLYGVARFQVEASDYESGVSEIVVKIDDQVLEDNLPDPERFEAELDTTTFDDGYSVVTVTAYDFAGNQLTEQVPVQVANLRPAIVFKINGGPFATGRYIAGVIDLEVEVPNRPQLRSLTVGSSIPALTSYIQTHNQSSLSNLVRVVIDTRNTSLIANLEEVVNFQVDAMDLNNAQSQTMVVMNIDNRPPRITFQQPRSGKSLEGVGSIDIQIENRFTINQVTLNFMQGTNSVRLYDTSPFDGLEHFTADINTQAAPWQEGAAQLSIDARDIYGSQAQQNVPIEINNNYFSDKLVKGPYHGPTFGRALLGVDTDHNGMQDVLAMSDAWWVPPVPPNITFPHGIPGHYDQSLWVLFANAFTRTRAFPGGLFSHVCLIGRCIWPTPNPWPGAEFLGTTELGYRYAAEYRPLVGCDVNGDGWDELIQGRPQFAAPPSTPTYSGGLVSIHVGPQTAYSLVGSEFQREVLIRRPVNNISNFGNAVDCSDLNGDGKEDVLVSSGVNNSGDLFVFYGNADINNVPTTSVKRIPLFKPYNARAVGDIDGDGSNDLMIRDSSESWRVVYGPIHQNTNIGNQQSSLFNISLPGHGRLDGQLFPFGDVDGDGRTDVGVICPQCSVTYQSNTYPAGTTAVAFGAADRGLILREVKELPYPELSQLPSMSRFGEGGMSAGDVNGDGHVDIAIASPYAPVGSHAEAGQVHLYWGPEFSRHTAVQRTPAEATGRCGRGVALTDTNGDGWEDVVFSCSNAYDPERTSAEIHVWRDGD